MISCIILSAGLSSRFGAPKALALLSNGQNVITHQQETLISAGIDEVVIVLGAHAEKINPFVIKDKKIQTVYNKDYSLGQTSSFKKGLEAVSSKALGVMLLPVDYPAIQIATFKKLVQEFDRSSPLILIPAFNNQKGHPPVFEMTLKREILALGNDVGLNTVARSHAQNVSILDVDDPAILRSFNTPEEFTRLKTDFNL